MDTLIPFAVVPNFALSEAPKLLHPYVEAAKASGASSVHPMFCPSHAVGAALASVVRKKDPYALIMGKNPEHTELAAYVTKFAPVPLTVFVSPSEHLRLESFENEPVSGSVTWTQMDHVSHDEHDARQFLKDPFAPSTDVFEAKKK